MKRKLLILALLCLLVAALAVTVSAEKTGVCGSTINCQLSTINSQAVAGFSLVARWICDGQVLRGQGAGLCDGVFCE